MMEHYAFWNAVFILVCISIAICAGILIGVLIIMIREAWHAFRPNSRRGRKW